MYVYTIKLMDVNKDSQKIIITAKEKRSLKVSRLALSLESQESLRSVTLKSILYWK